MKFLFNRLLPLFLVSSAFIYISSCSYFSAADKYVIPEIEIDLNNFRFPCRLSPAVISASIMNLIANNSILPFSQNAEGAADSGRVPVYTYRIVKIYPHDRTAYTQGLVFYNGFLYEGTGLEERSTLRKVNLESGEVLQLLSLPSNFFGEGITIFNDKIYQLTWQDYIGFIYDVESFNLLQNFDCATEGWGITHDESRLIISDGTSWLHFVDPETFAETGKIEVRGNGNPVTGLNELEYIKGEIYANIYPTNRIAKISPESGRVTGWIELRGLLNRIDRSQHLDVLNGIAYDKEKDRLFVTGKLWNKLFEIELVPVN